MRFSDDLFELVKSMTKAEKRYFQVYVSRFNNNNLYYLDLFNAIDKQSKKGVDYDEKALLSEFRGQRFFKNFSVAKTYLYKKILRVMREFYAEHSTKDELIREMISNIKYLTKNALYEQAKKLLIKAHKIADDHERFTEKLALIKQERCLLDYITLKESREDNYNRLYKLEAYCIDCIKQISEYENIGNKMLLKVISLEEGNMDKLFEELAILNNNPLLQNENVPALYGTKRSFYHAKAIYYRAIKDYNQSFVFQKKRFELFNEYPQMVQNNMSNYVSALHNLLLSCVGAKNQEDFDYYLEILRTIQSKEKKVQCAIFTTTYRMEINMYLKNKQFDDAVKIIPLIKEGLEKYQGSMATIDEQNILFDVACLYFQLQEYNKTIEWINKLLNYEESIQQPYIQSGVRIMQLFVYYELGHFDSLPYLLKSGQRYFLKKGAMFEIESKVLSTLRLLIDKTEKKQEEEIYENFKEYITHSEELILAELISRMGF